MENLKQIEDLFKKYGFEDYKWISGKDIKVAQWVRFKCMYGCSFYGEKSTCPPNVPDVSCCREFFSEFSHAVVFHIKKQVENEDQVSAWCKTINNKLSKLEKEVFITGFYKAFVLYIDACNLCTECANDRTNCKNKKIVRPCTEALAVDVYGTARSIGYPIKVLSEITEEMNRYAILLIE